MNYLQIKTLYIEVTHSCNQNCRHCYLDGGMHHTIDEMSTEQIKQIIKQFRDQGGKYIIVTGGEPLMRTDIFEILDYINELELLFNFASNSLAMNETRLSKLAGYKNLDMYFTSILGLNPKQHKEISGKNSFDKALEAIKYFDQLGISTYVQITLANEFMDEIEQIAELLLPYKKCIIKFTPIGTLGIKSPSEVENYKHLIVPRSSFKEFHSRVKSLQEKYPDRIEDSNIQSYNQIIDMMADYKGEELYSLSYGFLAVRPNGDMSFSCNIDNPYTFGKAYEGVKIPIDEKLKDYVQLLKESEKRTLEDALVDPIEVDVTVDKYIRECVYLHIPEFHELQYRQNILQQPETMDYNKGFNIAIPGYDKNTGCILFAIDEWEKWYKVWVNNMPSRYYAYIVRKYDNTFIGEVNLHKHQTEDWYEMGIVIEGKYRGMGYAKEALRQMLEVAFEAYDAKVVHNSFEVNRRTATYIHKALGFKEITQEGNVVDLWITKEDFHKNQRNNIYN